MQKRLILLIPLILAPCLSACQDKEHSVIAIKTSDENFHFVELDPDQTKNIIASKQGFALECYTDYCVHCKSLEPLLKKYIEKSNNVIYRLNFGQFEDSEDFHKQLGDVYPNIFKETSVPQLLFIKDGELTYEVNSNKFSSYTALEKILNKHFITSNITMITSLDALKEYEKSNSKYVSFMYDTSDNRSLEMSTSHIVNSDIASSKKPIVLINKASFDENLADLLSYFNTSIITFASYKNGDEIKTIDYTNEDGGSQLDNLISNL